MSYLRRLLRPSRWFQPRTYWLGKLREEGSALINMVREAEDCHRLALSEIRGSLQNQQEEVQLEAQRELARARTDFQSTLESSAAILKEVQDKSGRGAATWENSGWDRPADARTSVPRLVRVGTLSLGEAGANVRLPALVPLIGGRSVIFEAPATALTPAIGAANSLALRLLACMPPGRVRLLLIDPTGLGRNVAGFLHLADFSPQLATKQAWYQPNDIEKRLEEISAHMAAVTQRSLRTKYKTIEDFNADAADVSEPYYIVLAINFPHSFSEKAAREIAGIFANGPRCGVLCIVVVDSSSALPYGFDIALVKEHATLFSARGNAFVWRDPDFESASLELDGPPAAPAFEAIVRSVGQAAIEAEMVRVPFSSISAVRSQWWTANSGDELKVGLGRTGAKDVLYLCLGRGLAQNVLIVGRPGSGKSTLLHILIANLVATYPPDELSLFLVDFKEGVEFKQYADSRIPHIRVVAVHSEREFGLSVLRELHREFQHRGAEYRLVGGGQTVAEYRDKACAKMPRILLVVDEFQKFFVEDDRIAAEAKLLLHILISQGRAFGIHVLLSSQTLAGSFSLPKATLDLVTVRIALQCSEADSRHILGEDNPAASHLSRPGEGIYNDSNGAVASNVPFQIAWLSAADRAEHLKSVAALSTGTRQISVVFDGDEPVRLEDSIPFRDLMVSQGISDPKVARNAWLGEPVTISKPIAARFLPQEGRHLAVVGRDERTATGVLVSALAGLLAQYPPGRIRIESMDLTVDDSSWSIAISALGSSFPGEFNVHRQRRIGPLLESAVELIQSFTTSREPRQYTLYLVVFGLHRVLDLRGSSNSYSTLGESGNAQSSTGDDLMRILRHGPEAGVHVICWSDTVASMKRCLERQGLDEFGMRVALPMQDNESDDLLGSPAASRLQNGRALFFDNLDPNELQRFRPYELPSNTWITSIGRRLGEERQGDVHD